MFTGEFEHSVDSKNRIFVPAKFREELGESFMVARTFRGTNQLMVHSLEGWNDYIEKIRRENRAVYEQASRYLHRIAIQVCPDTQGRILLTPSLLAHAEITKEAYFVGCGDFCEIWSKNNYETAIANENDDDIRKMLESLGL